MNTARSGPTRLVVVPKVAHLWYDDVLAGARHQVEAMNRELNRSLELSFAPPAHATVAAQEEVLRQVLESEPAGIAIDPVESATRLDGIARAQQLGIPVVVFDSPSPEVGITGVGNDFAEQGEIAARRLVELLDGTGEVAVMRGVPDAPNHRQRYDAQLAVLAQFPGIVIVDGGTDHDDIAVARREALAVLAQRPDLRGYLACDASGPIGIAEAIVAAGRTEQVHVVGMDSIRPIAEAVASGVLESSVATIPRMQGAMAVLMLWQAVLGLAIPRYVDTGIEVVTRDNASDFL